jgi:hypothetical protein
VEGATCVQEKREGAGCKLGELWLEHFSVTSVDGEKAFSNLYPFSYGGI